MNIKNWFVKSSRVKNKKNGLVTYVNYLVNAGHKNHKDKTKIYPLFNTPSKFIVACISEAAALDMRNASDKGGRPVSSYAQSLVLSLPGAAVLPDMQQWNLIFRDVMKAIAKQLDCPAKELRNVVFANIHSQENPHLNIVIGRVVNGCSLKRLDQKSLIVAAKSAFNIAVKKHYGYSYKDYCTMEQVSKTNSRRSLNLNEDQKSAIDDLYVPPSTLEEIKACRQGGENNVKQRVRLNFGQRNSTE